MSDEPEVLTLEPEPVIEPVLVAEEVPVVVATVTDLEVHNRVPETALDADGRPYNTGKFLYFNVAGDEVPAPSQSQSVRAVGTPV